MRFAYPPYGPESGLLFHSKRIINERLCNSSYSQRKVPTSAFASEASPQTSEVCKLVLKLDLFATTLRNKRSWNTEHYFNPIFR
uniref:Uncharacterized protein n=1 Tax=Candidatus Kentrum sp. LPFa TaxID=2126335 RepID=A0A450XGP2_9GAMM|nr:MAG: hypothetical protein BECKLPF1236C_GA0070990_1006311 [Candidatus Kentron sp. LPFa]